MKGENEMTKVVAKFTDGEYFNAEADGFFAEGDMFCVYKRVSPEDAVKRMSCYENVGNFKRSDVSRIYVSNKEETR